MTGFTSFTTTLANLVALLQGDDMQAFAEAAWSKPLKAKSVYKPRTEIPLQDLPVILVTRPQVESYRVEGVKDATHTVRLYAGFHQPDREIANEQLILFDEKIRDLIDGDFTLGGTAVNTTPGDAVNSEGKYHPVYWLVMNVEIYHRRYPT